MKRDAAVVVVSAGLLVSAPHTAASVNASLSAITCTSRSNCTAVGNYAPGVLGNPRPHIEHWNGTKWSVMRSPSPSSGGLLYGISCYGASDCTAVGTTGDVLTLAEHWNGVRWSIVQTPNPAGTLTWYRLFGVACPSASNCTAVGYFQSGAVGFSTLIEHWNGSKWLNVKSPNPRTKPLTVNTLRAVACRNVSNCTAVGSSETGGLVVHWNGKTWSAAKIRSPSSLASLNGVACSASSNCTAVGEYRSRTLIEHWDGTRWSAVASPNLARWLAVQLNAVICAGPSSCTAVGGAGVSGVGSNTVVEHWNGKRWSIASSPNPNPKTAPDGASLSGVACSGADFCFAVGNSELNTLAERWNGKTWSTVKSPN